MVKNFILNDKQIRFLVEQFISESTEVTYETPNTPKPWIPGNKILRYYFNSIKINPIDELDDTTKTINFKHGNTIYSFDRADVNFGRDKFTDKQNAYVTNDVFIRKYGTPSEKDKLGKVEIPQSIITDVKLISKEKLFDKLNSLGSWVYKYNGLGFRGLIDDKLKPIKEKIKPDEVKKFTEGATILYEGNKISKSDYDSFIMDLTKKTLVYIDGKWHFVNKLNTNYSDISLLIRDLIFKDIENNPNGIGSEILKNLSISKSEDENKKILIYYKPQIISFFNKYIKNPEDLFGYTERIKISSGKGAITEDMVINRLEKLGFTEKYKGGDGDFIDMIFSVDLIVENKEIGIRTIQVKSNKKQVEDFITQFREGKHQAVDVVIYPDFQNRFIEYNTRTESWSKI